MFNLDKSLKLQNRTENVFLNEKPEELVNKIKNLEKYPLEF